MKKLVSAVLYSIFLFMAVCDASASDGSCALPKAYIDISMPPYNVANGADVAAALKSALDSLHYTHNGGTVYLPGSYTFGRPVAGSQKGVPLWANCHIVGNGGRITFTNNCSFASTDFGTDSLGTTITANVDSSTTVYTVASSTGFHVGDTVYIRLTTAPYDAGEPLYFGFRHIAAITDGTHITLDAPAGGNMTVAGTSTLNRRIIRIHNLTTDASVENLELYSPGTGSALMEAGIYVQGGINITVDHIRATNPGAGMVGFQFCENCMLTNAVLDASASLSNPNWGRGATYNECEQCKLANVIFNKYEKTAFVNESNNINFYGSEIIFNNNFSDIQRTAIITLGSGTSVWDNINFRGFQQTAYDNSMATGNLILRNAFVQKGTPLLMYEQQGVTILPPLSLSEGNYYLKKTFVYKFTMPVNAVFTFDSLPKGLILSARVTVDDTTGCTAFFFRRDASNTNNALDFHSQLRPGQAIAPAIGATFQLGNNVPSNGLNYNEDKSFFVQTNATAPAGKTATITMTYLEKNGSALLNKYNALSY